MTHTTSIASVQPVASSLAHTSVPHTHTLQVPVFTLRTDRQAVESRPDYRPPSLANVLRNNELAHARHAERQRQAAKEKSVEGSHILCALRAMVMLKQAEKEEATPVEDAPKEKLVRVTRAAEPDANPVKHRGWCVIS